jgi:hypothetical protein
MAHEIDNVSLLERVSENKTAGLSTGGHALHFRNDMADQ